MDFGNVFNWILLALGFGFVIFWHELGHFLAAKWAGVKVDQFAVGFGTAAVAWRKGIGFRVGSTQSEYRKRIEKRWEEKRSAEPQFKEQASPPPEIENEISKELGLGETEYRLNWLPLGGYVKMLGQDDLNPNAQVTDPRAYNMQPIPKRMVIVSAGVIMNIILAAFGFFALFLIGFNVQPPIVGAVQPGSPAQKAGLEVGDRIVSLEGKPQADFTKIFLNVALLPDEQDVPIEIQRPDGTMEKKTIRPARPEGDPRGTGMLALGIMPEPELRGLDSKKFTSDELRELEFNPDLDAPSSKQIGLDDEIIAINGVAVHNASTDYYLLDRALQSSDGKPIDLTVRRKSGAVEHEAVQPTFMSTFNEGELDFAGMVPRTTVLQIQKDSVVKGKLKPGDIITSLSVVGTNDVTSQPTRKKLQERLNKAGQDNQQIVLTVLRNGVEVPLEKVIPNVSVGKKQLGLGVQLPADEMHAVVGGVMSDSAADRAGVPQGATLISLNGQPVSTWHDVRRVLRGIAADHTVKLVATTPDAAEPKTYDLKLSANELERVASYRYTLNAAFRERIEPRRTKNFLEAARWGVGETRDLIFQFYLTLKHMVQRSVPASNLMGPLGIVQAGSKFAHRGTDWLIWFLSMISANLAVVNFLPIPIVDGGLFLFLIIEKLQGKPLSSRTQSIAQVVGLALILSVFIFVTYQDIIR